MKVSVIILAGGTGTRLAPISTPEKPKQFLDLNGCGKTLLEQTANRALGFARAENIWTVGNIRHENLLKTQLSRINFRLAHNIILEEQALNTAPAVFMATLKIAEGIVVVMPSDHLISGSFSISLMEGFKKASAGNIVTFGITPKSASTNFGYILDGGFYEKPDEFVAEELIKKSALWNSGIYVAKAETLLAEFKKYQPDFFEGRLQKISFDHAIAEKTDKIECVPASFEWDDLGTLDALNKYRYSA